MLRVVQYSLFDCSCKLSPFRSGLLTAMELPNTDYLELTNRLTDAGIFYNTPLELGIVSARRESISTAIRMALAKALNVASII